MTSSNVLTLEDFVYESINFFSSDTYYDLEKECLEFQLESLQYTRERKDVFSISIFESSSSENKIEQSKNKILSKIKKIWKTIMKALKTFLKNIINVFTNSQNKQIEKLESQAKASKETIDNLLKNEAKYKEKIVKLNEDLNKLIDDAKSNDKIINYLKSSNAEKSVMMSSINKNHNKEIKSKNDEIKNLHEKLEVIMRGNNENKVYAQKILDMVQAVLAEPVTVNNVPLFVIEMNKYISEFRNVFSIIENKKFENSSVLFARIMMEDPSGGKMKELINSIRTFTSKVERGIREKESGLISIEGIKRTEEDIKTYFDNNFSLLMSNNDEDVKSPEEQNVINKNSVLFSRFISCITKLVFAFQAGVGEYIEHTKELVDARKWALELEYNIQNIIYRINIS